MRLSAFTPSSPPDTKLVLAVNLSTNERYTLLKLLDSSPWGVEFADRLADTFCKAASRMVRVIVCNRELPEGDWKLVFHFVRDLAHAPQFILASRLADEALWAEILNLGGYDLLAIPFDAEEVRRVLTYAMDSAHAVPSPDRHALSFSGRRSAAGGG
jgi:DNA-binding NtrC family response regulator